MNERGVGVRNIWRVNAGRIAATVAAAGLLLAAGCGEDPGEAALSEASIKLASLSAGTGAPMPDAAAEAGYREVISLLQGISNEDSPVAADAAVLVSAAQRGLGVREASRALTLERSMLSRMPDIRSTLEAWKLHNAAAQAAAAYDPAAEFARIDRDLRQRQDEAEQQRAVKSRIEAEVADLLGRVTTRLTEASRLRAEAGELRLRIPRVSETEGLELAKQIRTLSRQADGLELEATELKTQADYKGVDLHAAEVAITKLESQIALLAKSREAVQTRHAASQARAASARADAQVAAALIAELIDTASGAVPPTLTEAVQTAQPGFEGAAGDLFGEGPAALTPFVTGTFEPRIESAASQLRTAASTAGRARQDRRNAAQLAIGQAQQGLGDVHWIHARGMGAYAQVLEELADAAPPLPASAEYAGRAEGARAAAKEAKLAAFEAYTAAKDAYESSGATGDASDRMNALTARLAEVLRTVGAGVADADALQALEPADDEAFDEPTDDPSGDEPAADEPVAGGDPVEELRAAIAAALAADEAGDPEAAIAFLHPATPADAPYLDQLAELLRAWSAVDTATEAAFGQSFSDWLETATDPALMGLSMMSQAGNVDPDEMDIRVQGDEGVALTGQMMQPEVKFRRIDGEWKQLVEIAAQVEGNPMAEQQIEALMGLADAFRNLADGVESGAIQSNAAVGTAVRNALMAAMGMPGGG